MYFIELHFSEQHWLPTRTMESCVPNFTSLMLSLTPGWLWSRLPGSISPGWSFIFGDGEGLYCSERVSPVISARVRVGKEKSLVEGGEMSQLWWEWQRNLTVFKTSKMVDGQWWSHVLESFLVLTCLIDHWSCLLPLLDTDYPETRRLTLWTLIILRCLLDLHQSPLHCRVQCL